MPAFFHKESLMSRTSYYGHGVSLSILYSNNIMLIVMMDVHICYEFLLISCLMVHEY